MPQTDVQRTIARARARPSLSKGYAAVFATIAIWSMPSLFLFYINSY
jgi:hypothetical protein